MDRPRIFIGSSVEGLAVAENIQLGLDYQAECTIWHQGVFGLSSGSLENLSRTANEFDFAILILTPDDLVHKRGEAKNSPRDNVIFELGLFMGVLGRERTYIVHCRDDRIDLPTDLAGVTAAKYGRRTDGNLLAAVGPVCTQIKAAVQNHRKNQIPPTEALANDTLTKLSAELKSLKLEFSAQTEHMRRMMESLTSGSTSREAQEQELHSLEGVWKSPDSGSTAYARVIGGQFRFAYCYGANDKLTGEYYGWRVFDGSLIARFRWVDGSFSGYVYLKKKGANRLDGGWWLSADVPEHMVDRLPSVEGMVPSGWIREAYASDIPRWAEHYFDSVKEQMKRTSTVKE